MDRFTKWLDRITHGDSPRKIASRVPYSYSTVARWMQAREMPAEATIHLAHAYGANVLEALVACQHITARDATISADTEQIIRSAPGRILAAEVTRRLDEPATVSPSPEPTAPPGDST